MSMMFKKITKPRKAMGPKPLSNNAKRVLDFIVDFEHIHGMFPGRAHIIDHMQWAYPTSYNDVMLTLVARGKIEIIGRERSGRGFRYTFGLVHEAPTHTPE